MSSINGRKVAASSNLKHQFKPRSSYMNGGKNFHQTLSLIHEPYFLFCHKAIPILFWVFFIFSFSSIQSFGISRFLSELGAALSNPSAFDNNGSFTSLKWVLLNSFKPFPPLMTACAKMGRLDLGQKCHGQVVKNGVDGVLHVQNSLMHFYSCCGFIGLARQEFSWVECHDDWVFEFDNPGKCLKLFREMSRRGLKGNDATIVIALTAYMLSSRLEITGKNHVKNSVLPDEITFVGVLCACAREGLLTEGRKHFGNMSDVFVESNLPSESSLWSELLGSARFGRDVSLGEQIANKLIDQDPKNFWHYLLLVNIYAAAGCWDDVTLDKGEDEEERNRKNTRLQFKRLEGNCSQHVSDINCSSLCFFDTLGTNNEEFKLLEMQQLHGSFDESTANCPCIRRS
ncbi:hypothetical protein HAX54_013081 [Datura stramonium]|uniref:Pentatricopeptide repeat-containing protein n=1 Tax=Datura stramonium TaxID=4076 RepID=A0ABS8RY34_DATST|nr:hypothetical protein [Datura stramonium]